MVYEFIDYNESSRLSDLPEGRKLILRVLIEQSAASCVKDALDWLTHTPLIFAYLTIFVN